MTRVQLLGPVRAWQDGVELPLGPSRQRALFAVLAASTGRVVGRDELAHALWGEHPPGQTANSLYTYVSRLRRVLRETGAPPIQSAGSGYRLRVDPEAVDLLAATRSRQLSAELARQRGPGLACQVVEQALACWRGRAFDDVDGPFAEAGRVQAEELRLELLERRAGFQLDCGQAAEVATDLSGLVRAHPNRESLRSLLMLALHRTGRRADALALYQDTRRHLVAEMGLEPGAGLRRAHELVLSGLEAG
ncbi:DNA-binding SARP family transcriptional activator [Crossiella equi]|uniref:DNA-binding SARP family transcriptional activator n=1 Tax=Crossiella equi TaxID=130796 RepID=A0ABS5ARK9_9PSEU|nr:BTAD domain-containing putative transcriptional regulator [Crossiella equi]MBP2479208.1 DNA-binding SARP family transcriptional activator [Crossiella equi]